MLLHYSSPEQTNLQREPSTCCAFTSGSVNGQLQIEDKKRRKESKKEESAFAGAGLNIKEKKEDKYLLLSIEKAREHGCKSSYTKSFR